MELNHLSGKEMNIIKGVIIITLASLLVAVSCEKDDNNGARTFEQDLEELNDFLLKKESDGFNIDTTELGVYYILREEGEGPYPEAVDTCYIEYVSYFLDGSLIDKTKDYFPNGIWRFVLNKAYYLNDGLKDGIKHMNKGCKMDLIIPSHLAYGKEGKGKVPPNHSLIYVVTMHNIKPPEDN